MIRRIGPEEYDELCARVGTIVEEATPAGATVAVVSKGDPRLVQFDGRTGLHFPSDGEGGYAGFYPRTGEEAIAQVEAARGGGTEFLCLPATAFWWLKHYETLAAWLGVHCRVAAEDESACVLYDLLGAPAEVPAEGPAGRSGQLQALLDSLLPVGALLFVAGIDPETVAPRHYTVRALGRGNPQALRRRLGSRPDLPTFLLVSRDQSASALDPVLQQLLEETDHIAERSGLCELRQMKAARRGTGLSQSPPIEAQPSTNTRGLDGPAADELTSRLERLRLARQYGALPESTEGVRE
jgi:hypothetical protein